MTNKSDAEMKRGYYHLHIIDDLHLGQELAPCGRLCSFPAECRRGGDKLSASTYQVYQL